MRKNRMKNLTLIIVLALFGLNVNAEEGTSGNLQIEVYRSPSCGCCSKWLAHLRENQFDVKDFVTNDVQAIKEKYGVTQNMASCHTAIIDGYVVEGHVPADDIKKMLALKPEIIGISVPGMPVGTPGMEMGAKKDAYEVISFDKQGNNKVFSSYEEK